jgi:hypothetical protein
MRALYGPSTGARRGTFSVYGVDSADAMALRTVGREHRNSFAICRMLFSSTKYARRIASRFSTLIISPSTII